MDKCSVLLCALGSLLLLARTPAANSNMTRTLSLLTLVPFFDSRPDAGWDRGLEILPMGRIAKDEINQREDILPGYELELIEANSEACSYPVISRAFVNLASNAIGLIGDSTVVGITGLPCSTVTATLSPLAGREEVSLIQMSMANSPDLRNSTLYPHLWRTVSSSVVYVNAMLALMDKFNWSKISTVYDDGFFYYTTTRNLISEVQRNRNQTVTLDITVYESGSYIESALDQVKPSRARVIFVSSTQSEAALIMCAAAQKKLTSPGYQWIFHSHSLESILNEPSECDKQEVLFAMENVILLQWELAADNVNRTVYSGKSIQELNELYFEELKSLGEEEQYSEYAKDILFEDQQPWAYPLYDEIWAFALALNMSLPDLEAMNFMLNDYHFGNELVTQIIEDHLTNVSFEGAVGHISFDAYHESQTSIKVYQVKNGTENLIGSYSSSEGLLIASDVMVASDEFEEKYHQIPQALRVVLYLINAIILVMITSLLILTLFYHQSPVVKANSTLLSSLIFLGCYCICLSSLANTLLLEIGMSETTYTVICNIGVWYWSVGLYLILGTNLVKLGRIYRIFTHMGDSGCLLTNYSLFLYVLLLGIFPVMLISAWTIFDTPHYANFVSYHLDANPPHVDFVIQCNCQYNAAWLSALFVYLTIMLMLLIFFASQTRKIKLVYFKDTKKTLFFVVFLSLTLIATVSSWTMLSHINQVTVQYQSVVLILGNYASCLLCLGFLFAPKVLPVFYQHITTGHYKLAPNSRMRRPRPSTNHLLSHFK